MLAVKRAFDPQGLLNPGITVGGGTTAFDWDHTLNFCFVAPDEESVDIDVAVRVDSPGSTGARSCVAARWPQR